MRSLLPLGSEVISHVVPFVLSLFAHSHSLTLIPSVFVPDLNISGLPLLVNADVGHAVSSLTRLTRLNVRAAMLTEPIMSAFAPAFQRLHTLVMKFVRHDDCAFQHLLDLPSVTALGMMYTHVCVCVCWGYFVVFCCLYVAHQRCVHQINKNRT